MAEPNFEEVFGVGTQRIASGATVAEGGLFIPDSALVAAGLTTPESASAEGHFAAVVVKAKELLTSAGYEENIDQSIYFEDGFNSLPTRGDAKYRIDQVTINFAKPDNNATLNPGDY